MKSKLGFGLITGVSIAMVLLLASCSSSVAPPGESMLKTYNISVQAKGSPKKLDIDPDNKSKCKKNPGQPKDKYGCIDVGFGQQAKVSFKLSPSSWHMTEMKICDGATKDPKNCSLGAGGQEEFAVMVKGDLNRYKPDQYGLIKFSDIPGQITEFMLIDLNNISTVRQYFYTLKACKNGTTDPDDCADTDPPITNGGRQIQN